MTKFLLIFFVIQFIFNLIFLAILYRHGKNSKSNYSKISDEEYKEFQEWINNRNNKKKNERNLSCRRDG